jgi:hypothetical protein
MFDITLWTIKAFWFFDVEYVRAPIPSGAMPVFKAFARMDHCHLNVSIHVHAEETLIRST